MNSNDSFENLVSLPVPLSQIKAPGTLLKDKRDPSQVKTNANFIKSIFQNSLEKSYSTFTTQSSYQTPPYETMSQIKEHHLSFSEASELFSPKGTPRSVNFDDETQISLAKRIFLTYGLELIIDVTPKHYQQISKAVKVLVLDICTFHSRFFKKIELKDLIICQKENLTNIFPKSRTILVDELIKGENQVLDAFYRIIFSYMISHNCTWLNEWKEDQMKNRNFNEDTLKKIEEDFVTLMSLDRNRQLKPNLLKFQELLMRHYPEEMPGEWFQSRRKDRKKTFRVSFLF